MIKLKYLRYLCKMSAGKNELTLKIMIFLHVVGIFSVCFKPSYMSNVMRNDQD
jgi:hypothetical protein